MRLTEFETEKLLKCYGFLKEKPEKIKSFMAYKDFTFVDIENKFGIRQTMTDLFPGDIQPIYPSEWLKETLERTPPFILNGKTASEAIIFPVLNEIAYLNRNKAQLFSGEYVKSIREKGLTGKCDFTFCKSTCSFELTNPVFEVAECKEYGLLRPRAYAMAAARMLGLRIFNQKHTKENPVETIYGACTTGYEWIFLKLEENTIFIDKERYYLIQLPQLLGILQHVVDFYD